MTHELLVESVVNPVLELIKRLAPTVVILFFISCLASLYLTPSLLTLLRVLYVYTYHESIAMGRWLQFQYYMLVYPPDHPNIQLFDSTPSALFPARSLIEHDLLNEYSQLFHSQVLNNIYEYHGSRVDYVKRLAAALAPVLSEMQLTPDSHVLAIDDGHIDKLEAAIQATTYTSADQLLHHDFMAIVHYLKRTTPEDRPQLSQFCMALSLKLKEFEKKLEKIPSHYYRAKPYYKFLFTLEKTPLELQQALALTPTRQLYGQFLQFERLRSSLMQLVNANPNFDDAATVDRFTARLKMATTGVMTPIQNYFLDAFDNLIVFRQDLRHPSAKLATALRNRLDDMELAFIYRLFPYIRNRHLSRIAMNIVGLIFSIHVYFKVL